MLILGARGVSARGHNSMYMRARLFALLPLPKFKDLPAGSQGQQIRHRVSSTRSLVYPSFHTATMPSASNNAIGKKKCASRIPPLTKGPVSSRHGLL